jgi:hypothetical protein
VLFIAWLAGRWLAPHTNRHWLAGSWNLLLHRARHWATVQPGQHPANGLSQELGQFFAIAKQQNSGKFPENQQGFLPKAQAFRSKFVQRTLKGQQGQ